MRDPLGQSGIAQHNPGNVKPYSGMKWRGQVGITEDGYAIFSESRWGLRAVAVIWQDFCYYHGLRTLREYVDKWVPGWMLESPQYLGVLAAAAAVDPDESYNPCERPIEVLRAIVSMENGYCPFADTVLQQAIDQAHIR